MWNQRSTRSGTRCSGRVTTKPLTIVSQRTRALTCGRDEPRQGQQGSLPDGTGDVLIARAERDGRGHGALHQVLDLVGFADIGLYRQRLAALRHHLGGDFRSAVAVDVGK